MLACVLLSVAGVLIINTVKDRPVQITQENIDAAVRYSLQAIPPEPSVASTAYEVIRPSVVRVENRRLTGEENDDAADTQEELQPNTGTGVVIADSGLILTSLHVVAGAERLMVIYFDGFETDATVVSAQPENDLAVVRAEIIPEGLVPATITSTAGLALGDEVVAVGHPFGIGPSVSAGVVSGLGRTYLDIEANRILTNMIQFDAAVNPGSSGGPLVNRQGEVIGIVTAIYNPSDERVFVGIGFAVPIETAAGAAGRSPF